MTAQHGSVLGSIRLEREIGGRKLILETGKIAKLCDAAVI